MAGRIAGILRPVGNPTRGRIGIMEILLFAAVAIALYFAADWILRLVETRAGRRLENRSVYFFCILLASALLAFNILRALLD